MSFNRIVLDSRTTGRLATITSRTGIPQNIGARIALLLSLREEIKPDYIRYNSKGKELNRTTLFGDYDVYIISLVKLWMINMRQEITDEGIRKNIVYHINNGTAKLLEFGTNLFSLVEVLCELD